MNHMTIICLDLSAKDAGSQPLNAIFELKGFVTL